MKTVFKKMLSLVLVAILLVSAVPFQASAAETTYEITFKLKNSEDGSNVGEASYTAAAEMEFYAGKIVNGLYGYEVVNFAANGNMYEADASFVPTADTTVAVYVKVTETKDEEVVPSTTEVKAEETVAPTVKEEPATYTILLNVYQIKDDEATQWKSEKVTLTKDSATLSELVAASGYGKYESVYAMIDGARFSGTAAIAIDDGDQIDLFITPASTGNKEEKPSKGEKVTLRVYHNDGTSNYTEITCRTTDNLLDVIEGNEELAELDRDGYTLIGWAFEANNDKDQEWIASQHKVSDDDDLRVYADWQENKPADGKVQLRIYLNENTEKVAKTVNMDSYADDGKITLTEATKVVEKYYEQADADDDMDVDGLFTKSTWNGGDYDMDDAKSKIYVNDEGSTIIYVMVRDAKLISNNDNDVVLRIYVNGNTKSVAKVVNMAKYATDGKITLAEAEKVVNNYYEAKYDDDDMDVDGLFTKSTWDNGDYDMDDAKSSIKVNSNSDTIIYVMVRDAQKISSGTADSSNPKTGDTIFMAVTVMALSASALALVYFFNKKRAVK